MKPHTGGVEVRSQLLEIICRSDTHELHRGGDVPDGDLLIHAGDITFFSRRPSVLTDFNDWLGEMPHLYKVVIPGNHDTLLEDKANRRKITTAHLLINEGVELGGVKIWGTPVTALDCGAFALPDDIARAAIWARIPTDTDILVTHIPPARILDGTPGTAEHSGCESIRNLYRRICPQLHVFGHVHIAAGTHQAKHTNFVNVALAGEFGDLDKRPVVVRLPCAPQLH
jgi:Icc-related predicted phosphoesterase